MENWKEELKDGIKKEFKESNKNFWKGFNYTMGAIFAIMTFLLKNGYDTR